MSLKNSATSTSTASPQPSVWLRGWRSQRRLSVGTVADYLGYRKATIYRWEAGVLTCEHPMLLSLALMHYDCRSGNASSVPAARPLISVTPGTVTELNYWLGVLGRGVLSASQFAALRRLRDIVQAMGPDKTADSADPDADSADTLKRGRWRRPAGRIDPSM